MNILKQFKFSLIWAVVMLIACTAKMQHSPDTGVHIPYLDKIVHFAIFAVLGFLISYEKKSANWTNLAICAGYGLLIEIIQIFLPWRSFELADLLADTIGALAGIQVVRMLIHPKNTI
jgi:VanZ family protein